MVRVKIEKLVMTPSVIPKDLDLPPVADEDKTIGRRGQMQGARIVTKPDKKEKMNNKIMED